ncbi:putative SWR1-complex protein 4 [Rosellinia necatrix]|uniref:SWR1-complex protein 4 n=1 Tax=Rosellinia necatrix TaxID=77044 RepID=A0A1W2TCX3_ROSNE|nr:putative SWR1-complex protein 4 [Rosellinia necatrix]
MASHDVLDVLNLPADGAGPRPPKKQKTAASRPNLKGLAREVQSLGGDNPIAIVPEISTFKKRRFGSRKQAARWELSYFRNSARNDQSLVLRHWKKEKEEQARAASQPQSDGQASPEDAVRPEEEADTIDDSGFAKFNVQVDVPQYSEDQYNSNLVNDDWTKDETDYLFGLAREFDLRWPLIWDRYEYTVHPPEGIKQERDVDGTDPNMAMILTPKVRTMEDLKQRYYEVAAKMMAVQKPVQYMTQAEFSLHEMMAKFNPTTEIQRKKFAQDALSRSADEAREEEQLLVEVRRIVARQQKLNQDRQDLYRRLDFPPTEQDISSFKSSTGLSTLLQNLATADRSKKRKPIMDANGANTPGSAQPSAHPTSTPVSESRRESIAASTGGHRDSIGGGERPERPTKKGAQQQQQQERKKLTEQEEKIYGVSHHDRLPSGPTFRYDRINKILTTKSNAQHQRITNTLTELDIPGRLNMPTRSVVEAMEKLLNSIGNLLETRKLNDKLDAEIRLEQTKKAERKKALGITTPSTGTEPTTGAEAAAAAETSVPATAPSGEVENTTNGDGQKLTLENKSADDEEEPTANPSRGSATNGVRNEAADDNEAEVKTEDSEDKDVRPESSIGRKRSASVLSGISDKSTKRLKK